MCESVNILKKTTGRILDGIKEVGLEITSGPIEQWYSTGGTRAPRGTRRHLRGYVKFKISIYILFHE
jgi:hypothetical protein